MGILYRQAARQRNIRIHKDLAPCRLINYWHRYCDIQIYARQREKLHDVRQRDRKAEFSLLV